MHFRPATVVLALSSCILAHPALGFRHENDEHRWPAPLESFYEAVGKRVASASGEANYPYPPPTESPAPVGRGTQNYTCDTTNSSAVPVAVGAVASLYNASCVAALYPELLSLMPNVALQYPAPSSASPLSPSNIDLSGHHYFVDASTPFFDLDTPSHAYGTGAFRKAAACPAPGGAPRGPLREGGHGSVAWLKLAAKGAGQTFQEVYRINTAGGNPPASCAGQPASLEVDYAAEYWLYQ
ncbi:hypothetical protein B0A49_01317 [Cryomyces minteri]|uniref:Malate dehydrogenase n=1 Tax=Cryomyces minteri TaxID=331657 RepID=A0A4U0XNN0_9PEZI|nr:hypothetical protein B0A49_01317 [Cryomyces minteri]